MSKKNKALVLGILGLIVLVVGVFYLKNANFAVLQPAGTVGQKERNLILFALMLSVIVVAPVFILLTTFAWKYREGNEKASYAPDFASSRKLESIWWGIPFAIIFILSIVTWNSSHDLDPFKPLSASGRTMHIQVIALQWKWLFIYPDNNLATVNFVQFPVGTPVDFEITSDAPMNSFWIPQLGGQIYAMAGMSTHLNLMASKAGDYSGKSANISGKGFAHMTFTARASSQDDFYNWSTASSQKNNPLSLATYDQLSKPNTLAHPIFYSAVDATIYNTVVNKYMGPQDGHNHDGMGR
jgi:cytochrome o ubiquinol oxidase subunit 2